MKEVTDIGSVALSNRMYDLEKLWQAAAPNADVVYIGTPWERRDLTTNRTETQNIIIREAAVRDERAYVDCMTPMISYQWMTNQGYMRDHVHLSAAGNQALAEILWDELGFYALRLDREPSITRSTDKIVLGWMTRTNVLFELQSSTNLCDWETQWTASGSGNRISWTNSLPGASEWYRLRLSQE